MLVAPKARITEETRRAIREHKADLLAALIDHLANARSEARHQRVLKMLAQYPTARYALVTDEGVDPEAVILTLAVRGQASCELRVPRDRFDPFLLLDLIERYGGTVH